MSCVKRLVSCHTNPRYRKNKEVYVLKLVKGKYYVGESRDVRHRIWSHVNHNGSVWTRKYGVIKRIPTLTKEIDTFWELNETLEQMKIHGINNVRGSMFSNNQLSTTQRLLATQLYCEKESLCRNCGSYSHFENKCNQRNSKPPWMIDFLDKSLTCVVCDTPLSDGSLLNYCGDFCRKRHTLS